MKRRSVTGGLSIQAILVVAVMAAGGWLGVREFNERLIFIKETDARVAAPLVTVSSRVGGWLTGVLVEEGQQIEANGPIVRLDDRHVALELRQLEVQMGAVGAERARLRSERNMVSEQMRTQMVSRTSRVEAASAVVKSLAPQLNLARAESQRTDKLFSDGVLSKSQRDKARNMVYQLEGDYLSAVARLAEAESERAETIAATGRTDVLDKEIAKLEHDEALLNVRIERHQLEMQDRIIRSPSHGVVDKVFVESGEYVRPGQRIAVVHDPKSVWVDANIKETELDRLKLDQPVTVLIDAFPDVPVAGRVARIGNTTTAAFALLPNPNPSGNFTKITQRVPIRVQLEDADPRLRPGMMVEVQIDVR
jgi:membrane fusion protein, multidrug efflux system